MKLTHNTLNLTTAIILGFSTMLMTVSVNAQNPDGQTGPGAKFQQMISQLNLDEETQKSLQQLMKEHRSQMGDRRSQKQSKSYEDFKKQQEMREKHRADIKALLGETKFEEFEKAMWMMRQNRRQNRNQGQNQR